MKYILSILTIALVCAATPVSAAFHYEVLETPYTNQYYQGTDWEYYTIRITEGAGQLYIVDYLNNIYDSNQTDSLKQQGITSYGYYDVNDPDHVLHEKPLEGNAVEIERYQASQWHNPAVRYGYELGTFSAGDEVEVYLSNGRASVSSNTPVIGVNTSRYDTGYSVDALANFQNGYNWSLAREAMPVAELTLYEGYNSTQVRFGFLARESGGRFGTPLPGGAAIYVAAGLFGLGFYFLRRRKAALAA